jgi:hypothetical protein
VEKDVDISVHISSKVNKRGIRLKCKKVYIRPIKGLI